MLFNFGLITCTYYFEFVKWS